MQLRPKAAQANFFQMLDDKLVAIVRACLLQCFYFHFLLLLLSGAVLLHASAIGNVAFEAILHILLS